MIRPIALTIISLAPILAACGGGGGSGGPCTGDETRCDGQSYQVCSGGSFETVETCAGQTVCDPSVGCAECTPAGGTTCEGDDVVACSADGTLGEVIESCGPGECFDGSCGRGSQGCNAAGVELIYVVDVDNTLLSFDPEKLGTADDPFSVVGSLDCPAGDPWPERAESEASPFSMSVDRNATAWVLYSSGEIFHVSTENASCEATSFAKGQQGFELFGMGFVTDGPDAQTETLFISGGDAGDTSPGDLATVDPGTMAVAPVGSLPNAELGPELTGTGDGKLFGYYPGSFETFVAEIDKSSGMNVQTYDMEALGFNDVRAWAFAHYGGKFYVFVTVVNGFGGEANRVIELDPGGPSQTTVIENSDFTVVGAGVSTCAPIVVD